MNTRQRFQAIMNFEPFDRLPLLEWANWWNRTIERWRGEGLPPELNDRDGICRHFGLDTYRREWFHPRADTCPKPACHGAGLIDSPSGYQALRPHLYPFGAADLEKLRTWSEEQARGESVAWFIFDGFFWFARTLLGIERHLYAFYDQPELLKRINRDLAEWTLSTLDRVCRACVPDLVIFAEDMSYNGGPMVSREIFEEFMSPFYALVVPELKRRGIIVFVDSDGDVGEIAKWFEGVGVEGLAPLERRAGTDVAALRARHPRMRFFGNFDKTVMNRGREAMRGEFERLLPTAAAGGFLASCDHQTPPGVSYAQYLDYLDLFREYAARAGRMSRGPHGKV